MYIVAMKLAQGYILSLIFIFLLVSCKETKRRNNSISKIEIATGECYKHCPQMAISIDSTLAFGYYGGRNAKIKGYYTGIINKQLWDTLNMKLEAIQYKKLLLKEGVLDDQEIEVIIHEQKKVIHYETTINYPPDSVKRVFQWLINTYNFVKLKKVNDTLKFETTYQYEEPPRPRPIPIKFSNR